MAKLIQAFNKYGPKLDANPTVGIAQVAGYIEGRTGLNKSEIVMCLMELAGAVVFFNNQGTPVKLTDLGTFRTSIDREGKLAIKYLADKALKNGLNAPGAFTGTILNQTNIGLDNQGYKDLWDAENPDDPLDI
jgi:hypothetical protein